LREGWARAALERFELLKRWREYVPVVARACREVLGDCCLRVYVVGGAAEDRLTVLSDIDVVIVMKSPPGDRLSALLEVRRRARELGLGDEVPLDLKLVTVEEFEELKRRGFFRKVVEVSTG